MRNITNTTSVADNRVERSQWFQKEDKRQTVQVVETGRSKKAKAYVQRMLVMLSFDNDALEFIDVHCIGMHRMFANQHSRVGQFVRSFGPSLWS